jgi:hypothetical protein
MAETGGPEIARAYVTIMPSMRGVGSAVSREFGAAGGLAGAAMGGGILAAAGKFAGPIAAAFSIGAIIDFSKEATRLASDLSEANNALNVTYGETADQLFAIRENSAGLFGLSKLDFSNAAVQMSNFAKTIGGNNGAAAAFEDIVERATDFASVMNIEVSDALGLFQSGLAGETEPLRRYGVDVSAATVQAYAYANGIAAQGEELTQAQKVQATWGAIVAQTNMVQGDFLNTSDQLANSQRILNARWTDAKTTLGEAFLPIALQFTEWLQDALPYVEALFTGISSLTSAFTSTKDSVAETSGALAFVRDLWDELVVIYNESLKPTFSDLARIFNEEVRPALDQLSITLRDDVKPAMEDLWVFTDAYIIPVIRFMADEWGRSARIIMGVVVPALVRGLGWALTYSSGQLSILLVGLSAVIEAFKNLIALPKLFASSWNKVASSFNSSPFAPFNLPKVNIPGLAEGGIVTSPTLALIGEGRGPEAVVPLDQLDQMLSGNGNGDSFTFNVTDPSQILAELTRRNRLQAV